MPRLVHGHDGIPDRISRLVELLRCPWCRRGNHHRLWHGRAAAASRTGWQAVSLGMISIADAVSEIPTEYREVAVPGNRCRRGNEEDRSGGGEQGWLHSLLLVDDRRAH